MGTAGLCLRRILAAFLQAKVCFSPKGGDPFQRDKDCQQTHGCC